MSKVGPFLLGGMFGAALGLLYAPRTGDQTRALVSEKISAVWGEAKDWGASAAQDPQGAYKAVQERGAAVFQDISPKVQEFAKGATAQASQAVDAARGRVKEATGQVEPAFSAEGGPEGDELRAKIEAARARIAAQVMQNAQETSQKVPLDGDEMVADAADAAEAVEVTDTAEAVQAEAEKDVADAAADAQEVVDAATEAETSAE